MEPNAEHYRYRRLSSGGNRRVDHEYRGAVGALVAEAGAVHDVYAEESWGTLKDLAQMLRSGDLNHSDLVFCDGRWLTFEAAPAFFDVCSSTLDRRKLQHTLRSIGFASLAFAVVTAMVVLKVMSEHR